MCTLFGRTLSLWIEEFSEFLNLWIFARCSTDFETGRQDPGQSGHVAAMRSAELAERRLCEADRQIAVSSICEREFRQGNPASWLSSSLSVN